MPENLFNSAHKATNPASRKGYDKVNWIDYKKGAIKALAKLMYGEMERGPLIHKLILSVLKEN